MLRRQNVQIQRQIRAATSRKLDFCQISFRIFKIRLLNLKEENGLTSDKGEIKIKSLQKALTILDCFAEKQPLGVTEISEKLGLYKSNTYDILTTLNAMGYLEKSSESSKYYLGKKLVRLGRLAADRYSFRNIAAPYLHMVANEVGEIAHLTVPIGYQLYYIDTAVPVGTRPYVSDALRNSYDNLNCTGSGKAMLSRMPEEFINEYLSSPLSAKTEKTIIEPDKMRDELAVIRARGYSVDDEEYAIGLRCVAVPILSFDGSVLGAMSVSGPTAHFAEAKIPELAKILTNCVHEIERNL